MQKFSRIRNKMVMKWYGFYNSLLSGMMAALAAVFTKVGFNFGRHGTIEAVYLPQLEDWGLMRDKDGGNMVMKIFLHIVFIIAMLICNTLMIRYYIRSMHENGASRAVVYNFTVNYIASLFFGAIFFDETITGSLLIGVVMILVGTAIIFISKAREEEEREVLERGKDS